jgi:hypothetical protein
MTNFLFTGAKKEAKIENMTTPIDVIDGLHMETKPSTNDRDDCGKPYVEGK